MVGGFPTRRPAPPKTAQVTTPPIDAAENTRRPIPIPPTPTARLLPPVAGSQAWRDGPRPGALPRPVPPAKPTKPSTNAASALPKPPLPPKPVGFTRPPPATRKAPGVTLRPQDVDLGSYSDHWGRR
jgi:hypothetical protein